MACFWLLLNAIFDVTLMQNMSRNVWKNCEFYSFANGFDFDFDLNNIGWH